ncbi:hypothetical protein C5N14_27215 [Micromonospora sp. MW-13]|nr:hypothetical protein C5N14_27215 [Micromonospora sp. MW-13]
MSRPRAATRAAASARVSTPATWAAVISPMECPATRSGASPQEPSSRCSATSTAKRPAWVNTVWSSSAASSVPGEANRTGFSGRGRCGSRWAQASSRAAAKTGYASASSRPIPARWAPWPEYRNATAPRSAAAPVTRPGAGRSSARAVRAVSRPAGSSARTTARCSRGDRDTAEVQATSAGRGPESAARWAAQRSAWRRSAVRVRPVSSTGAGPDGSGCSAAAGSSGCSRMRWVLVPLIPNEETAARRGRSTAGHGVGSVTRVTAPVDQSTCGVGSSTCRVAGTVPCRIACTILITPAMPAAAWVWPMFDLIEPSSRGAASPRSCPYVASSACASIGSPRTVPVPCASTTSTSAVDSRAPARAWPITRCWEGPLGAVRPLDAPSWLTAEPRITARTGWPLRRASLRRSSSSMPTPSDQPVPSADAANDLHRPSAASPRWRENSTNGPGVASTVAPPARARPHSRWRSAWQARWMATDADEQAVSTVTVGPSRPNVYASRPETTLAAVPVSTYPSTPGARCSTAA